MCTEKTPGNIVKYKRHYEWRDVDAKLKYNCQKAAKSNIAKRIDYKNGKQSILFHRSEKVHNDIYTFHAGATEK